MIDKPEANAQYGIRDGGAPFHSEEQLSRVYDLLYAAWQVGQDKLKLTVWETLDESLRMDFNWAKWHYVANGLPYLHFGKRRT